MGKQQIVQAFGNRLRVRVCGICIRGDSLLMVKHGSMGTTGQFWAPPGGGLHYGERTEDALEREFAEETGLWVTTGKFLFVHEFLKEPLHGIELFFEVQETGGHLQTGQDPEMLQHEQIIEEVRFADFSELKNLPEGALHNIFSYCQSVEELLQMRGLYQFRP